MPTHKITLIPGDGIGPEVTAAMVSILEAAAAKTGASFEWHPFECGAEAYAKNGETSSPRPPWIPSLPTKSPSRAPPPPRSAAASPPST